MAFNWKGIVSTIAPMIGTAIGGPVGGMAANAALTALGITPEAGNEEAQLQQAMVTATPSDLLKLKEADHAFEKDMKALDVDREKIAAGDRSGARQREIATGDNAPKILATVVVTGFFATLYTIAFVSIPASAQQPINILLGALTALLIQVGNYYFGSSAGSARKTDYLANSIPK